MDDNRNWGWVGKAPAVLAATALMISCASPSPGGGGSAPAPGGAVPDGWLEGSIAEQMRSVETQLRGLDVAMVEIGYRFGELHFAGQDRNWDYAKYQADKVRLALELALERRSKRAGSAEPFLKEDLPTLVQAIESKDLERYQGAMERLRTACMKCHVAESVPFFTVQFPEQRVSAIRPE
jgi:hypothetical protein